MGFLSGTPTRRDEDEEERRVASECGCSVRELRARGMAALYFMRSALKGGHINSGYAICDADPLALRVANGECTGERIQCREPVGLRFEDAAVPLASGQSVTHSLRPVGDAYLREILFIEVTPSDAMMANVSLWVTQVSSLGRFSLATTVTSTRAGQPARGFPLAMFGRSFHNFVSPTGVMFTSSNPLEVTITNVGADDVDSYELGVTLDQVRLG